MKKLDLFKELSVPVDVATDRWAFIGSNGSGKTYCASRFCELLIAASVQVGVIDTAGIHYNLRRGPRGGGGGLQVIVFGGKHADVPINPEHGAQVADAVLDLGVSFVIDLSQMKRRMRGLFLAAFAEQLWMRVKARAPQVLFLLIEEAHTIIPERVKKGDDSCADDIEEMTLVGRSAGVGIGFVTTRPQEVRKSVLDMASCLLAFQNGGKKARAAIDDWMEHEGLDDESPEAAANLRSAVAHLPTGEAFLWSPRTLRFFGRVHATPKETFDGGAAPKVGEHRAEIKLAPVDVDSVRERLKATIEETERRDPEALQRKLAAADSRVAQLESELARAQTAKPAPAAKVERVEVPAVKPAELKRLERLESGLEKQVQRAEKAIEQMHKVAVDARQAALAIAHAIRGPGRRCACRRRWASCASGC